MTVWDDLVGQERVSEQLAAAARDADALVTATAAGTAPPEASKMTHAWLFTGPPGSGRSTAARAFAAALQCVSPDRALGGAPGCGFCDGCHTSLVGTHADVESSARDLLSIGVKETRDWSAAPSSRPAVGRWQVIVMEDADRLTEGAGNVLLKAVEEPAPRTVWLLCAPSLEDVLPTIRSRCRHLTLRTPPVDAVADILVRRDGIEPERRRGRRPRHPGPHRPGPPPGHRRAGPRPPRRRAEAAAAGRRHRRLPQGGPGAGRRGRRGRQAARRGGRRQGDRGAEGGARRGRRAAGCRAARRA